MVHLLFSLLLTLVGDVAAQDTLPVTIGTERSVMQLLTGFSSLLIGAVVPIFGAVLTAGGITIAAAHGNDSWSEFGKKTVMGGVLGFCVTMGAYGIMRMLIKFIYF